jgi:chorismate dehydratase
MDLVRISAVSYLNTYPFVLGIKTSGELDDIELQLDVPSICAEKLKAGVVDLALVPAGALPDFKDPYFVSDYCIGAEDKVKTVLLLSHQPLEKISTIHLDFDSRSSVALVQVLANKFWKISPEWVSLPPGKAQRPSDIESLVAIGDKTFQISGDFPYVYDLAEEWVKFSGLPFVFAAWISTKPLHEGFLLHFNNALAYGVAHIHEVPEFFRNSIPKGVDAVKYFEENISYRFDDKKKKGLELFLSLLKDLKK